MEESKCLIYIFKTFLKNPIFVLKCIRKHVDGECITNRSIIVFKQALCYNEKCGAKYVAEINKNQIILLGRLN